MEVTAVTDLFCPPPVLFSRRDLREVRTKLIWPNQSSTPPARFFIVLTPFGRWAESLVSQTKRQYGYLPFLFTLGA